MPANREAPSSFAKDGGPAFVLPGNCSSRKKALVCFPVLLLLLLTTSAHPQAPEPATIRIAVLSLFHPQTLVLERQGQPRTTITLTADEMLDVTLPNGLHREVPSLTLAAGTFRLHVQGTHTTLTRVYRGALTLTAHAGELRPVVTMDTETAVAAVVQAESLPGAPPEALKAQAVAARSFLLANLHSRAAADTCDTTHCQLLQDPAPPDSPAAHATAATARLVLTWQPDPTSPARLVRAQWTSTCAGRTLPGHPRDPSDYPFPPVRCAWCTRHPDRWKLPADTPLPVNERAREAWNRTHPARQIPSLAAVRTGTRIEGQGTGHGTGLCQRGASDMAARGQTFREILTHYCPNTTLTRLP